LTRINELRGKWTVKSEWKYDKKYRYSS
jgi:hypothetical protein